MANKKILTIIKRLDRVIALLDNCYEMDQMSGKTRMRIIEMLHTSISEVYSFGNEDNEFFIEEPHSKSNLKANETINEILKETDDQITENDIDFIKPITEDQLNKMEEVESDKIILPKEISSLLPKDELEQEQNNNQLEILLKTAIDTDYKVTEKTQSNIELEDNLIELETPEVNEYLPINEQNTKKTIVKEELVAELEAPESIEIETSFNFNNDEELFAEEKERLNELRNQLEMERKRLEEELLTWQQERIKREEEMKAAEKLLTALENETQKRKSLSNNKEQIDSTAKLNEKIKAQTNNNNIENNGIKATNENTSKATVAEKLSSTRQFLYDNFNTEDLKTQGITSISDLTKAIGINDKFQFIKELFGGDSDQYSDTIRSLNNFNNIEEAFEHIENNFDWDKNNDAVKRIILLVKRRYM